MPSSLLTLFWNSCRSSSAPHLIHEAGTSSWGLQPHKPPQLKSVPSPAGAVGSESYSPGAHHNGDVSIGHEHSTFTLLAPKPAGSDWQQKWHLLHSAQLRIWLGLNIKETAICCHFHQWQRHHSLGITETFFTTGGYTSVLSQVQYSNDILPLQRHSWISFKHCVAYLMASIL